MTTGNLLREHAGRLIQAQMPMVDNSVRWPRRTRLLFVMTVASATWLLPAIIIYWVMAPH